MSFPILEFDPTAEAFIEPSKVIRPRDVPEHCVICFFKEVSRKSGRSTSCEDAGKKRLGRWSTPIYEIEHQGRRLAFYHPGIGFAIAAATLEEAIGFGCRKFIACGGCGVLAPDIAGTAGGPIWRHSR